MARRGKKACAGSASGGLTSGGRRKKDGKEKASISRQHETPIKSVNYAKERKGALTEGGKKKGESILSAEEREKEKGEKGAVRISIGLCACRISPEGNGRRGGRQREGEASLRQSKRRKERSFLRIWEGRGHLLDPTNTAVHEKAKKDRGGRILLHHGTAREKGKGTWSLDEEMKKMNIYNQRPVRNSITRDEWKCGKELYLGD